MKVEGSNMQELSVENWSLFKHLCLFFSDMLTVQFLV